MDRESDEESGIPPPPTPLPPSAIPPPPTGEHLQPPPPRTSSPAQPFQTTAAAKPAQLSPPTTPASKATSASQAASATPAIPATPAVPPVGMGRGASSSRGVLHRERPEPILGDYSEPKWFSLPVTSWKKKLAASSGGSRGLSSTSEAQEFLQAETSSVVQSPPEKEGKLQGSPPTPATHLKRILQEHDNFAKDCSEDTLKDNTFQLPYIAIGYFDHDGGSLSLGKYNVHLYIPRGALPKKSLQQVYIYVNPNAPPVDGIDPSDCVLSPMIQCGPTGLKFLDSVVLSFPHFAKEGSGWELRAQLCNGEEGSLKTWKTLDAGVDGVVVSTKGKTVVLLMKHFTGAALVGQPSATSTKKMQAGVFGSPIDQSEDLYSFRFHLWNDEPVVEQKVVEMEKKMGSQPLDIYRSLIVCRSGDVHAEVQNIKEGWELAWPILQKQTISVKRIWELPTDSVTFDLEHQDLQMNKAPHCDGFICQISTDTEEASNEDRVRFSIRPPKKGSLPGTETQSPCYKCRDDEARLICPSCKEAMKCVPVLKNRDLSDGDYGGLSEEMVHIFCKKGDTARVVAELAHIDHSSMEPQDSLKVFFGGQRASGVQDRTAVKRLLDAFDEPTVKNVRKKLRGAENSPDDGSISTGKPEDRSRLASEIDIEKRFRRLAEKLGPKWETLATELGCSSADLFKIKEDNPCNVDNQIFAMFVQWKQRCGWLDESILAKALEKAGRLDLAQQFREMTLKEDEHVFPQLVDEWISPKRLLSPAKESSFIFPQVETPIVLHTSPDGAGNVQGSPSTPPTHLKRVLEKHDKVAKDCSEDTLKDNTFQLPYIAIGYFDHNGGSLSLDKYNIHLYIPRGALPRNSLQQVYIYVNPNAPPVDGIDPSDCVLSPMIQCGPTGLKFLASVVLSFPHFAKEGSGWELRAQLCNDKEGSLKTWNNLHANDDGVLVSTKDKTVVLLMKHFTGAALVGQPSATSTKIMQAGVFGTPFDQSEYLYSFRFHLWNDEPVVKQKVVESENEMGSKQLDAYRSLIVRRLGDVDAEVENMKPGWEMATPTLQKQTISVERIWELPTDSVTFDLERHNLNEAPHCDAFISQEASTGGRVRFSIKPEKRESIPQIDKPRPCYKCRHDAAGEICPSCEEAMECVPVLKNRDLSDGDYGGLTEEMVCAVCEEADLARVLVGAGQADVGQSSMESQDSLTVFFGRQRARGVQDRTAVKRLLESLDEHIVKRVRKELLVAAPENSPGDGSTSTGNTEDSSWLASEIAVEQRFRWLATRLESEWEALATWLGLTNADLSKIKDEYRYAVSNQIFAMLVEWKRRSERWDESILAGALEKAGRLDLAQQFQETRTTSGCEVIENIN